ncbi:MAG: hypothetical protein KF773_27260 [Deltaproteobacteria bacterium]|nr:hypothetical protein [Deltaproteobacteria bacterium]
MRFFFLLPLVLGVGCAAGVEEPAACSDPDRCKSAGSREELLASIEGFDDPVAAYLRSAAGDGGTLPGDFRAVLDGVGGELGCDASTERSYVVLSNAGYVPKPIVTRCNGSANDASRFYMALVGDAHGFGRQTVHVAAWDASAGTYRRYATAPSPDGGMAVNVAPEFCLGCHGGPEQLGTWVPLMNEMSSPWANWNAAPGFASALFDEFLDPAIAADPTYREVAAELDTAAAFEPIVRAGLQRTTGARLRQRTAAADLGAALELLRPLFCDEGSNYVSEVHGSGELRTAAILDDALRGLYRSLDVAGGWSWLADPRTTLAGSGQRPIELMPVRGEATVQAELGLVARGVISPLEALRVRALDWKHPTGSAFRCDLWRTGHERVLALDPRGAATTADLIPAVLDALMAPLPAAAPGRVRHVPDASVATAGIETDLAGLGDAFEAHLVAMQAPAMRGALLAERDRRACRAAAREPTAPIFPGVSCP